MQEEIKIQKNMTLPRPNYYQGILQLRDVNDEIVAFVRNQTKKRGDVFITKTVKLANGLDFYMTSQKFIRILGKKLKDSFGGELKISSKLHTRNRQGKELYRVNAMFRLSSLKAGNKIYTRSGNYIKVLRIGKKVFARDLRTGRKIVVRSNDLIKQ